MAKSHHLFDANEAALPQVRAWMRSIIGPLALQTVGYQFITALDELCANIIEHADERADKMLGTISIELMTCREVLEARVMYSGDEFDLTGYAPEPMLGVFASQSRGGLGIRMIQNLTSKLQYRREGGLNICTLSRSMA